MPIVLILANLVEIELTFKDFESSFENLLVTLLNPGSFLVLCSISTPLGYKQCDISTAFDSIFI